MVLKDYVRQLAWLPLATALAAGPLPAAAQTGPAPTGAAPKAPKPYQGPLDVIMSSHLWTEVPSTQDFVTATHPDPKTIDYTSLNGKDPERPKPRDADGVAALQAELEQAGQMNEKKAAPLGGVTKAAAPGAKTAKRHLHKTNKVATATQ